MTDSAAAKLVAGLATIQPLLERDGFIFTGGESAKGSGGHFATATFARDDRQLHLWLRYDSLSVTYRIGDQEIDHATLMRELLGPGGPNALPAYAEDSRLAFAALRHDLESYCGDFLGGDGDEFRRCVAVAERVKQLSGPARLARVERQLERD
jgi:hypothetical protein